MIINLKKASPWYVVFDWKTTKFLARGRLIPEIQQSTEVVGHESNEVSLSSLCQTWIPFGQTLAVKTTQLCFMVL